ncbi:MAG: endolytic transglycosylase MltG [Bacillota bacterium]|nr:endolytic transglycosylase MltG [Bacillota bacterium]
MSKLKAAPQPLRPAVEFFLTLAGLALYAAVAFVWVALHTPLSAGTSAASQVVRIERGASTARIASLLEERGIIADRRLFRLASRLTGLERRLKAGSYLLSPGMSAWQVVRTLVEGKEIELTVTFPEGSTAAEVAQRLAEAGLVEREAFLRLAAHPGELYGDHLPPLLQGVSNLEGYLFPDTYRFSSSEDASAIARRLVDRFLAVAGPIYARSQVKDRLTFHEFVTLASLVEKEAALEEERPLVAAVFLNRLRRHIPLQSCATVNYVLPERKARLSTKDLAVESPYNTYLHRGLPPGPIANPGRASLEAVAHPARVDYLYFVARGDGGHYFSRTFREHLQAKNRTQ